MAETKPGEPEQWIQDLTLYQYFLAEREEILKHKWLESQKEGRDVGFEYALTDWMLKHRSNWRKSHAPGAKERASV